MFYLWKVDKQIIIREQEKMDNNDITDWYGSENDILK